MNFRNFHLMILPLTVMACIQARKLKEDPIDSLVNENEFKVHGSVKGLDVDYMFIDYTDEEGERVWDTLFVDNEYFEYTAVINQTKRIALWPLLRRMGKNEGLAKQANVEFLARPGDIIEYSGDVTDTFNAYPSGTDLCDDQNSFDRQIEPIKQKILKMDQRARLFKSQDHRLKMTFDSMAILSKKIDSLRVNFVAKHTSSELSAYYLSRMVAVKSIEDQLAIDLLNKLNDNLMTSPFYINVATRLKGTKDTAPGNIVPDLITKRTLNGKEFNLTSLRGKYVLIDFWGTWCGPCVQEMPQVKAYKEKYDKSLVVVGIDSGDKKERVEDFVSRNGYDWIQLMSQKGGGPDDFVTKFNVNGFPTKFIIGPDGKILYRFVGNAEEAFVKLDELLGS